MNCLDRRVLAIVIAGAAIGSAAILGGCQDSSPARERTCTGAQAISSSDIHGDSLPAKTISLSFDDGPGPRTAELSTYLKAQGIRASFFVNGKMLGASTAVLQQLVADGHVVANHAQTHTSLTGRATGGEHLADAQIVAEVTQTDTLIAPFVQHNRFMFRAPFGDFSPMAATALDASPMKKYVGPINWEIGDHMGPDQAADWDCWTPGADGVVLSTQQCGDLYVKEIDNVGRGIVLLHDPYFIDNDVTKGGTVDMEKYIEPTLVAKGYKFARNDEDPVIAAMLPALPSPPPDAGPVAAPDAGTSDAATVSEPPSGTTTETSPTTPDPCRPQAR
jgi:peptidoglycan/xylan/chitin deacetylase (PgdA/CDA1 family)